MTLYHVSADYYEPKTKLFTPRVPKHKMSQEDSVTPRICLGPTIERCLVALPDAYDIIYRGSKLRVYSCEVTRDNCKNFIPNQYIVDHRLVSDAHITQEVWCTAPIEMTSKLYMIMSGAFIDDYAWDKISVKDMVEHSLTGQDFGCTSSYDLYKRMDAYDRVFINTWLDSDLYYQTMSIENLTLRELKD